MKTANRSKTKRKQRRVEVKRRAKSSVTTRTTGGKLRYRSRATVKPRTSEISGRNATMIIVDEVPFAGTAAVLDKIPIWNVPDFKKASRRR